MILWPTPGANGILLSKLLWTSVRQNYSSDWEKLLKFEAEGREFADFLRSLEQYIETVKGQNNSWYYRMLFSLVPGGFSDLEK